MTHLINLVISDYRELEVLASRKVQLDSRFQNFPGSATRAELLANSSTSHHDDQMLGSQPPTSIEAYRQEQKQILQNQDEGLENLSKVISRQKQLAMTIGNELEDQNGILDNIADQMDNNDTRLQRETSNIGDVTVQDSTCGYWIVIISLFVAIIIVGII